VAGSDESITRAAVSGHSHRVELFLSLPGLPFEIVNVDLVAGAHKKPDFLAINAFGQVPVIEDGEVTRADSNAILVYLARSYALDAEQWLPSAPGMSAAGFEVRLEQSVGNCPKYIQAREPVFLPGTQTKAGFVRVDDDRTLTMPCLMDSRIPGTDNKKSVS
jgi:glutathione S-transferase